MQRDLTEMDLFLKTDKKNTMEQIAYRSLGSHARTRRRWKCAAEVRARLFSHCHVTGCLPATSDG